MPNIEIKRVKMFGGEVSGVEGWWRGTCVIRIYNHKIASSSVITGWLTEGEEILECFNQSITEYKKMRGEEHTTNDSC